MFRRIVQEALGAQGHLIDQLVNLHTAYEKDSLRDMIMTCFKQLGVEATAKLLDALKDSGFKLSTSSGITIGIDDIVIPPVKDAILADADLKLKEIEQNYEFGFMTEEERYKQVVQLWNDTTDDVKNEVFKNFEANYPFNPLWIMSQSGARGNPQQIRQLAGMRGLMARPDGSTIEVPIKASFREGLTVLEYFISTHGARKGGADTALRTADSGYLTRKLVDVAHEVVVRDVDCGTTDYTVIPMGHVDERSGEWRARKASEIETSIYGRTLTADRGHRRPESFRRPHAQPRRRQADHQARQSGGRGLRPHAAQLPRQGRGVPEVLRLRPVAGQAGQHGRSGGRGGRRKYRRTRHPAHHAHLPHRRCGGRRRHHHGSAARDRAV